jgi:hypothetical protein
MLISSKVNSEFPILVLPVVSNHSPLFPGKLSEWNEEEQVYCEVPGGRTRTITMVELLTPSFRMIRTAFGNDIPPEICNLIAPYH